MDRIDIANGIHKSFCINVLEPQSLRRAWCVSLTAPDHATFTQVRTMVQDLVREVADDERAFLLVFETMPFDAEAVKQGHHKRKLHAHGIVVSDETMGALKKAISAAWMRIASCGPAGAMVKRVSQRRGGLGGWLKYSFKGFPNQPADCYPWTKDRTVTSGFLCAPWTSAYDAWSTPSSTSKGTTKQLTRPGSRPRAAGSAVPTQVPGPRVCLECHRRISLKRRTDVKYHRRCKNKRNGRQHRYRNAFCSNIVQSPCTARNSTATPSTPGEAIQAHHREPGTSRQKLRPASTGARTERSPPEAPRSDVHNLDLDLDQDSRAPPVGLDGSSAQP